MSVKYAMNGATDKLFNISKIPQLQLANIKSLLPVDLNPAVYTQGGAKK